MKFEFEQFSTIEDVFLYLVSVAPYMKQLLPVSSYKDQHEKDLRKYRQTIWMPTLKDRHPVEMFPLFYEHVRLYPPLPKVRDR
jgi:hypothetical protein